MLMRNHFMKKKSHPWPAQIRDNLGSVLGNIVLRTLPLEIQEIIGIEKRLNGPGKQLWNSPSNQLLGKHKLIPYKSPRKVLAFTHQKIQSLGEKIEKKIARRVVKKMLKLAQKQNDLCLENTEVEVNEMRKKTIREFYVLMSFRLRELHKRMKEDFTEAWDKREAQLFEEANLTRNKGIQSIKSAFACEMKTTAKGLEHEYNTKLNFMVEWCKSKYRDDYLQRKKYLNLEKRFTKTSFPVTNDENCRRLLHKWSELFEHARRQEDAKMREMLEVVQTQNQIHLDAAILAERENAAKVFLGIVQFYQEKLTNAQNETDQLVTTLRAIIEERNLATMDGDAWQCALKDIMRQFQKFINYVLKEMPGQADYLLSLREIASKRRECMPRVDRRFGNHKPMGHPSRLDACWEDTLKLTKQEVPRIISGSSLNLPKAAVEEDGNLEVEDTLQEIANGQSVHQTRQMIMEATEWLLEGVREARNVQKRESRASGNVRATKTEPVPTVKSHGLPKLLSVNRNNQPANQRMTQKDELDKTLKTMRERDGGTGPKVDGVQYDPPEHCAGPFVQNRINSLLDIFDGHPHLKQILFEP